VQVVIDVTNPWKSDYSKLAASSALAPGGLNPTCDLEIELSSSKGGKDSAKFSSSTCSSLRSRDQGESI
jgi:hypothetical protein